MKKYLLPILAILLIIILTSCSNSKNANSSSDIENTSNSINKIDKEIVYNKYYELLSKEYNNFVLFGTFKVYQDHNKYMSDFLKRYHIDFLDINDDGIDELFLFEYQFGPYGETQIENSKYVEYVISIFEYSDDINDKYEGITNIKSLFSFLTTGLMDMSTTNYSFSKDKSSFFQATSMLDAINVFFQNNNNNNTIMTKDYVEALSKQWSIYDNFYELRNIKNGNTELYLSGDNSYAKVIDNELIVIDKNELDSVINSLVKINFDKMDSGKINIDIEYPNAE